MENRGGGGGAEPVPTRVSFETSFDSKQPKLGPIGTIRNKMFVSVVSLLYRNREF
jgi:hypothetical protein